MAQLGESQRAERHRTSLRRDRASRHVRQIVATVGVASAAAASGLGVLIAFDTTAHSTTVATPSTKATTSASTSITEPTSSTTSAAASASDHTTTTTTDAPATTTTTTKAATTTSGQTS
jgi:cytoskeletal protein RodZ